MPCTFQENSTDTCSHQTASSHSHTQKVILTENTTDTNTAALQPPIINIP